MQTYMGVKAGPHQHTELSWTRPHHSLRHCPAPGRDAVAGEAQSTALTLRSLPTWKSRKYSLKVRLRSTEAAVKLGN